MSFIHFRRSTADTDAAGLFTTRLSAAGLTGARGWLPKLMDVSAGTAITSPATGGGQTYACSIRLNTVDLGTVTIPALSTQVSGSFNISGLPAGAVPSASDATMHNMRVVAGGGAPAQAVTVGMAYSLRPADDDINWHATGDEAFNVTLAATDRFLHFGQSNSASVTTVGAAQVPWPVSGTFRYCFVGHGSHAGETVSLALNINGSDTALVFTLGATGVVVGAADLTTVVNVTAGDLVCWRFNRTAGGGVGVAMSIILGFNASS